MPARQMVPPDPWADTVAHFIGDASASLTDDGGLPSVHRKDGNKKDTQVVIDPLEVGLHAAAEGT